MAAINAIKYFNAVNATLFTSGVFPDTNLCVPAVSQLGETELKMEKAEGLLGRKFLLKRQNGGTIVKTKLYVACVKLNLVITEAALSAVFTRVNALEWDQW